MGAETYNLVTILKAELAYLEQGGYRNSTHTHWYPKLIFRDSPTCLNFLRPIEPRPCSECPLMQFVPAEQQGEKIPCRHIPLTEQGTTLDSMYRYDTLEETEATVGQWLKSTIQRLESEQNQHQSPPTKSAGIANKGTATG
jgi:hypothetical protein